MNSSNTIITFLCCLLFTLLPIQAITQCDSYDLCSDVVSQAHIFTFNTFEYSCIEAALCVDFQSEVNMPGDPCIFESFPTAWSAVTIDSTADELFLNVATEGNWIPVVSMYLGTCENLVQLEDLSSQIAPCSEDNLTAQHLVVSIPDDLFVDATAIVYIACSSRDSVDIEEYTLCLSATKLDTVCNYDFDHSCNGAENFKIVERSFSGSLDGPFYAGEELTVCFDYIYDSSMTGSDWIKSITPSFGSGWDMDYFDATVSGPFQTNWYAADADCGPIFQDPVQQLCTYTNADGRLVLCNVLCEDCPCEAGVEAGSLLPSSWVWESPGGDPSCDNDNCSPSYSWGFASGVTFAIEFCMSMKVKDDLQSGCKESANLQMTFHPLSDEYTGCWNDPTGACALVTSVISPAWETTCAEPPSLMYTNSCGSLDSFLQEHIFCDLSDMHGLSGSMFAEDSFGSPNPLCTDGGAPHNTTWFAFVAPSGEYELTVTGANCIPGMDGSLGFQMGIYTNCDYDTQVFCDFAMPIMESTVSSALFTPGELYYLFLDGWAFSTCDFEFEFICLGSSCDPLVLAEPDPLVMDVCANDDSTVCVGNEISLQMEGYENLEVSYVWDLFNETASTQQVFNDIGNALNYTLEEPGHYIICATVSDLCNSYTECEEFDVITQQETIVFPPIAVCEGELIDVPNYNLNGQAYVWNTTIASEDLMDVSTAFVDTVFTACCFFIQTIEVSSLFATNGSVDRPACPYEFPFDIHGTTIEDYGDYTILLAGANSDGCDSLLLVDVVEAVIKGCNGSEDYEPVGGIGNDSLSHESNADLRKQSSKDKNRIHPLRVYPNPVNRVLHIDAFLPQSEFQIFDVNGKLQLHGTCVHTIDVSELSDGVYILRLSNKQYNNTTVHKLTVMR